MRININDQMMQSTKKGVKSMIKKAELSFLNILFCALVILIHVLSEPITHLEKESLAYAVVFFPWRLSAFVVQGFVFLAGVKMALGFAKPIKYIEYVKSRFFKVVIPYIIWAFVFYICFVVRGHFEFSFSDLAGYILRGDLAAHFYFVITIVQFYFLRPVWKIMTERIKFPIAVLMTVIIMVMSELLLPKLLESYTDRVFTTYLIFWVFGCYVGANYECFKKASEKNVKKIIAVFFTVFILEALLSYISFTLKPISYINTVHTVYCVCAVLFAVAFSLRFGERLMKNRLLRKIDASSYHIYLAHPLCIVLINKIMRETGINSLGVSLVLRAFFVYSASIAGCLVYTKLIRKKKL